MQLIRATLATVTTVLAVANAMQGNHFTAACWSLAAVCWLANLAIDADRR